MAQTGYTPILIYSSTTASQAPAAGNLTNSTLGSELAINITDGKLFYKDNANAVQVIAWKVTPTTAGGTGLTSYTAGDLLYYATGTTLSKLAIGTSGRWLGSSGTAPQWNAPAALTKTDDTNVTLTLGGSASTALLNAASLTLGWTGTLAATRGGTGLGSYAVGDLLYADTTTSLAKLADVATGNALISGGVGVAPSWGKIGLTTHISGVLPVANGGTNASSASITAFNNITGYSASGATGTTSTNLVFSADPVLANTVTAKRDSATLYPIIRTSNRTGSGSSHVVGAYLWDAYRDVADPSYVGGIWIESVNPSYQDTTIMYLACQNTGSTSLPTAAIAMNNNSIGRGFYPVTDNSMPLGLGGNRWSVVYSATALINTSDANQKTDIAELDDAEKRVAIRLKSLIKKFRYKDAVEIKGDKARIHVGAIAQEVAAAFVSEGLDAARYGVFCSDTFRTFNGQTVITDKDNFYVEKVAKLNGETIQIVPGEELPEGAEVLEIKHPTEEKTRLGLRYDQLFAFVISQI